MAGGGRLAGGDECRGSACCCVEVEAGIDAERGAIVQEAATRPFGRGEDLVGLLQGQRRESDGQKISRLWSKLANVFDRAGVLRIGGTLAAAPRAASWTCSLPAVPLRTAWSAVPSR